MPEDTIPPMAIIRAMLSPPADLASELDRRTCALGAKELMRLLGYEKSAFYQMCKDARIPHFRIGTSVRFDPHEIAQWMREHHVGEVKKAA
jgi:excisionase family DNA binding protein